MALTPAGPGRTDVVSAYRTPELRIFRSSENRASRRSRARSPLLEKAEHHWKGKTAELGSPLPRPGTRKERNDSCPPPGPFRHEDRRTRRSTSTVEIRCGSSLTRMHPVWRKWVSHLLQCVLPHHTEGIDPPVSPRTPSRAPIPEARRTPAPCVWVSHVPVALFADMDMRTFSKSPRSRTITTRTGVGAPEFRRSSSPRKRLERLVAVHVGHHDVGGKDTVVDTPRRGCSKKTQCVAPSFATWLSPKGLRISRMTVALTGSSSTTRRSVHSPSFACRQRM